MEGIFQEFENENALRLYPFAAGLSAGDESSAGIPPGVFVDAALYPVNSQGPLFLSGVSEDGVFSVSDDSGVIMTGRPNGSVVEFTDMSGLMRHVGTLVASSESALRDFAMSGSDREFSSESGMFSASCVFPVVADGVTSLDIGGTGRMSGIASFSNGMSDDVRVSGSDIEGHKTIRFDIVPRRKPKETLYIKRVICVVDGETPFRIQKLYDKEHPENYGYNTVILSLDGIDRDSVCALSHRENSLEMADTCECDKPPLPSDSGVPEAYQLEEVFVPPDPDGSEGGAEEGADNAFFLVVPNYYDGDGIYYNPISITLEDGAVSPRIDAPEAVVNGISAEIQEDDMVDNVSSKGIVIQVPGLSGGAQ